MCNGYKLKGSQGTLSLDGYRLPTDSVWFEQILETVHVEIPGSHDLLIAIMLPQQCLSLRKRSAAAITKVLTEYEATVGQLKDMRAKTYFSAAITELKIILDELKDRPTAECDKVVAALTAHFGADVRYLDTSFEGLERTYLLAVPVIEDYWLSLISRQ